MTEEPMSDESQWRSSSRLVLETGKGQDKKRGGLIYDFVYDLKIKFKIHLHEAICISHICLSRGYRESSIMQENLRRSLKNTSKDNLISAEDTCLGNYRLKFKGNF